MKKEDKDRLLKQLSKSSEGIALKEYLEETINKMTDIFTINSYEELIGKQIAIKLIKETFRFLDLLSEENPQKSGNQYV